MSEEKNTNAISKEFFENSDRIERQMMYEFTVSFNSLVKALHLYGPENDTVVKNIEKVFNIIKMLFSSDASLSLTFNGHDFLINDTRVKKKKTSQINFGDLERFFIDLQVATISFQKTIRPGEMVKFILTGFNTVAKQYKPEDVFDHFLNALKRENIYVELVHRDSSEGDDMFSILDKCQLTRLTYRNMITDHGLFLNKIRSRKPIPLRKALRNVQNIIDLISDGAQDTQEPHVLTLASLNSLKNRFIATHLANVAVLSVASAFQLGIDRNLLTRIGVAAYFHDIGLPENSKGENSSHTQVGFAVLSRLNSLSFAMMEAAINAGRHHDTYTFMCEPIPPEKPVMSTPLGEILKVCDYYDLATRWWPNRKTIPLKRTDAIEMIFKMCEMKCFSPIAAKALFSAVGIFPPGTIVKIREQDQLACSIDVFRNTGQKSKAAILDKKMSFIGIDKFYPQDLVEVPEGLHFRLPPLTIKKILDSFEPIE